MMSSAFKLFIAMASMAIVNGMFNTCDIRGGDCARTCGNGFGYNCKNVCEHLKIDYHSPNQCNSFGFDTDNNNCKAIYSFRRGECCNCSPAQCKDALQASDCDEGQTFNGNDVGTTTDECCVGGGGTDQCEDNYDGNDCAGGIEFFNPTDVGSTGEECCICGPSSCFSGCDPNWECVARRKLEKIEKKIRG